MESNDEIGAFRNIELILLSEIEVNPLSNVNPNIFEENQKLSDPILSLTDQTSDISIAYADFNNTFRATYDASFLHAAGKLSKYRLSEIQNTLNEKLSDFLGLIGTRERIDNVPWSFFIVAANLTHPDSQPFLYSFEKLQQWLVIDCFYFAKNSGFTDQAALTGTKLATELPIWKNKFNLSRKTETSIAYYIDNPPWPEPPKDLEEAKRFLIRDLSRALLIKSLK